MSEIVNEFLNKSISLNRIIDQIEGANSDPTIIFIAGIHGNESSGVFATSQVFKEIRESNISVRGSIYAIAGNIQALIRGARYCVEDLNRIWSNEHIGILRESNEPPKNEDVQEQIEILKTIDAILKTKSGPIYFIDLHTTSSETIPFAVFSDSILNRKFAENFPIPLILGIEEYLEGALLSYYNSLGYVSIGYEAGSHTDLASYENQIAFIYLCLVNTGIVEKQNIDFYQYFERLAKSALASKDVYEILFRFKLNSNDQFEMERGFVNFQAVKKGQLLAVYNGENIKASHSGRLFMPLYQHQGSEGFFEIRKIPKFLLHLSAFLRQIKFDSLLVLLPGIRYVNGSKQTMKVDLRIARFFTKPFLHLLGYRSKKIDKTHLIISSVETNARYNSYKNALWRKNHN